MFPIPDQKRRRTSSFNALFDDEDARDAKRHATDESGVGRRSSVEATRGAHEGEDPPDDVKTEYERNISDETEPPRLVGIGPLRHVKFIDCQAETQKARQGFVSQIRLYSGVANPFEFTSWTMAQFPRQRNGRQHYPPKDDLQYGLADLLLALELGLTEGDDAGQNNDRSSAIPGESHASVDCTATQPQPASATPRGAEMSDVNKQPAENERVAEVRDESVNIMRRLSASFENVALHRIPAAPMKASPLAPSRAPQRRAGYSVPRAGPRAPARSLRAKALQAGVKSTYSDDRSTTESSFLRMYSSSGLQNAVELNNAIFEQQTVAFTVGAGDTFSSLGLDQAWCKLHEAESPTDVLEARIIYSELWRRANA
ncbi:hypothetical protein LTR56_021930 [Elasticomyces elasticus]|nr:hypothetical protein LTR56_021930 [Elasticomyces elasticus]KAK3643528.1 hypothetical protein LTR22_015631 [Elasticomyces elasticus]KAK4915036.1 hypothetical protein LTR49_016785 [Elasticomyces elasticus]KAK5751113.1 hypothetical protein LTS12_018836 [Elasticomyces elasticus]